MIRKLARLVFCNAAIHAYLRRLYGEAKQHAAAETLPETGIPEATPLACRPSDLPGVRLNLFIPALSMQHVFGGISTALEIFRTVAQEVENVRIILTDESAFEPASNPAFSAWNIGNLDDEDRPGRWIIAAGNRYGKSLPICAGDCFMASAWWTAIVVRNIRDWQAQVFPRKELRRYVYLIQDYEPGFYPWSSRYALAQSTYSDTQGMIAVFNTGILRNFFFEEGYRFEHAFSFEPRINGKLASYLGQAPARQKEKIVLVYGRPGTPRNAFELIVMGLRQWAHDDPEAKQWQILSVGEPHAAVDLGRGQKMASLGKLNLDEYASLLLRSAIGLSLMISPHPSYPPLEMVAFGLRVVTNRYKAKDLAQVHPNIVSLADAAPHAIADTLRRLIREAPPAASAIPANSFWKAYADGGKDYAELRKPIQDLLRIA